MYTYLPGTTVETRSSVGAKEFLNMAFASGGLVLSQVSQLTGLSMHTVQNWVKRKFVESPLQKKYDCNSFCTIAIINMLKDIFQIEKIVRMLEGMRRAYGKDAPSLIYICFSELLYKMPARAIEEATKVEEIIGGVTAGHDIPDGPVRQRLNKILRAMLLAYLSASIRSQAQLLLEEAAAE